MSIPLTTEQYFDEAKLCLKEGIFRGAILLSAAALENYLRDKLPSVEGLRGEFAAEAKIRFRHVEKMDFVELIWWARQVGFLTNNTWRSIDKIREMRNGIIHPHPFLGSRIIFRK